MRRARSFPLKLTNLFETFFRRNRSLSLSAAGTWSGLSFTPLRSRGHTSEAGSPTLEQVLLMSRAESPLANSSPIETSAGLYSSLLANTAEEDPLHLDSLAPSTTKPSFSELDLDSAVDEAYQNFLRLKQKQVALHTIFGQGLGSDSVENKASPDPGIGK